MYIYESSPRRSPRRIIPQRTDANVLKPKSTSPIRKGKPTQALLRKPFASTGALAAVTGTQQNRRKVRVNDENKENSGVVPRTRATGVNGAVVEDVGKKRGTKKAQGGKIERERLPLKELPLNGFEVKGERVEVVVL